MAPWSIIYHMLSHGMKLALALVCFVHMTGKTSAVFTCSQDPNSNCKCTFNDDTKTQVDFSTIGLNTGDPKFDFGTYGQQAGDFVYAFNPCYPFSEPQGECQKVVACQELKGEKPAYFKIGDPAPKSWTTAADESIQVVYDSTQDGTTRTSTVTYRCSATALDPTLSLDSVGESKYDFTVTTCQACRPRVANCPVKSSSSNKITVGGILCIVFTVTVVLYLVGGVLFMKYQRGASGTEVIPNYGFWKDFPGLVKDGFLFVISPCRKDGYSSMD
ncbi:uncharacterized protein [Diadema antillarum]|uniref:uncharacterized protein n=1 Tax=Diadema antillarum TaxID=105358 RepID=UPI003A8A8299